MVRNEKTLDGGPRIIQNLDRELTTQQKAEGELTVIMAKLKPVHFGQ